MKHINYKKIIPFLTAVGVFLLLSAIYFSPIFSGLHLEQADLQPGMIHQVQDYHQRTGEYAHWNDAMFGGQPSYLGYSDPLNNIFNPIGSMLALKGRSLDMGVLFLYMLGFYVMLLAFGVNPWIALLGSAAYAFGSYNLIIIAAGHITKAWSMAMIAPILAGIVMVFQRRWWGLILFTLALGLQIRFNHLQISYYTLLTVIILGIVYFVLSVKQKEIKKFLISSAFLVLSAMVAVFPNLGHLLITQDYAQHTMRGGAVLDKARPSDVSSMKDHNPTDRNAKGLDIDYAYQWSYGMGETFSLLVPDIRGGGSSDHRYESNWTNRMNELRSTRPLQADHPGVNQIANRYLQDTYWGNQPFTAGPVYVGSIICFLFLLGLFLVRGPERRWVLIAFVITILMSWGRHFPPNEWLFYHLPLYNKFRAPSMILVIPHVLMVFMGMLALKTIGETKDPLSIKRPLYIAGGITGGICLLFALMPDVFFSFTRETDETYLATLGQSFIDALHSDRKALLRADAFRSFLFIASAFVLLCVFVNKKGKGKVMVLAALGLLILIDLWTVDKRYVNQDNFKTGAELTYQRTPADDLIYAQAAQYGDTRYRVLDLAHNTFNDSRTSYFHNTIGGYHPAKLRRYQDIIDFYLGNQGYRYKSSEQPPTSNPLQQALPSVNWNVLNMLNTRYLMASTQQGQITAFRNPDAPGPAWFVSDIQWVENADQEILALNDFNPATTAVVNKEFKAENKLKNNYPQDSLAKIEWTENPKRSPDIQTYKTQSSREQVAVFSEIYFKDGWKAFLDGKEVPHFRVNYILRGMVVPAGNHEIEFRFEPEIVTNGKIISAIGSIVLISAVTGCIAWLIKRQRKTKHTPEKEVENK